MTIQQQQLRLESIYSAVSRNYNKSGATAFAGRDHTEITEGKRLADEYNRRRGYGGQPTGSDEFSSGASNVTIEDSPDTVTLNGKPLDKKALTDFLRKKAAESADKHAVVIADFFLTLIRYYGKD